MFKGSEYPFKGFEYMFKGFARNFNQVYALVTKFSIWGVVTFNPPPCSYINHL